MVYSAIFAACPNRHLPQIVQYGIAGLEEGSDASYLKLQDLSHENNKVKMLGLLTNLKAGDASWHLFDFAKKGLKINFCLLFYLSAYTHIALTELQI